MEKQCIVSFNMLSSQHLQGDMAFKMFILFAIVFSPALNSLALPIDLNLGYKSSETLDFNLKLPNNDSVQISLSFRLLTFSNATYETIATTTNIPQRDEGMVTDNDLILSTDNENGSPKDTDVEEIPERNFVTVEEAIEGFRHDLINKEKEIGGIIESDHIFYRHFKLEFDGDKSIRIRCTYDSNYEQRKLKISCYEYHELQGERILSNGEVEYFKDNDPTYKSDITSVDLRKMKQTYNMNIS